MSISNIRIVSKDRGKNGIGASDTGMVTYDQKSSAATFSESYYRGRLTPQKTVF
ncbi:hypothetical protein [Roseiconus lacunae]|uniref:hypothetical protein n=1 Tax=Roseiconus lacunae TaxID=2605694 RepID=UPI001E4ABD65|nr:hypothetical protein [Roseiconus lacunae]